MNTPYYGDADVFCEEHVLVTGRERVLKTREIGQGA